MNLLSFNEKFPDEKSCRMYLKLQRENEGITCKQCGGKKHYWLNKIEKWQCSDCKSRTNLRAGTMMEKSPIPVRTWFMTIHLMTSVKKPFSALEMQRQLGLKRYEPVWYMMGKIRKSMGKRDARYKLNGEIEMDDAFFEIVDIPMKDELGNIVRSDAKRGRGSDKQMKVLVMVESTPNPQQSNPHKKKRSMGYTKMVVMDELNNIGINYEVSKAVSNEAHVISDGWRGYSKLSEVVSSHTPMVVPAKDAMKKLPWVHTVISNAKRQMLGVHHSIGKSYLQNYLNEFCYKLNRRNVNDDLFNRMLVAGVNDTWY